MALVYMTTYMSSVGKVSPTPALWIGTACLAVFVLLLPPFIATFLVQVTGNRRAPAGYVVVAALVTLVFLLRTRETAFAPLR
jgi:hypothetical protein